MSLWLLVVLLVTMLTPSFSFAAQAIGESNKVVEVKQDAKESKDSNNVYKVDFSKLGIPKSAKKEVIRDITPRLLRTGRQPMATMFMMKMDRSVSPFDEVNPDKDYMDPDLLNLKLPLELTVNSEIVDSQKTLKDLIDQNKKLKVVIKQMYRGKLIETYTSQEFNADGKITNFTDSKGQPATKVPVYNEKTGYLYDYVIETQKDAAFNIHFLIEASFNSMDLKGLHFTYRITHLANSEIKVEVKEKNSDGQLVDYDRNKLDKTEVVKAKFKCGRQLGFDLPLFGTKKSDGSFSVKNPKTGNDYTTVLREDWGDQKLLDLDQLQAGTNDFGIIADTASSWDTDGSIKLKLADGTYAPFKVTTTYDEMTGGVVTFTRLSKVIKINEGDPIPKTHNKLVFQAGENGNLKDGDKSVKTVTFAVYKGMTWAQAKADSEIKLYIPTTQPATNYKFDDWYKFDKNAVDKNAKGLPKDSTEVEEATYQAEFIGKDGVVDVTPKTPGVEPNLPEKDNPNFDPTKKEDENNKKKVQDDDYVIVNFKSGDNGSLDGGNKSYAVLKTMTWDAAEKISEAGKTKLVVPLGNPDLNYQVDKWDPALPTDKGQTFATIFGSETTKTYVLKFKTKPTVVDVTPKTPGTDPVLPKKPDPSNPGHTTNEDDTDYTLIIFKAGDNGALDGSGAKIKAYAVLKTKTWNEAESDATKKLVVPTPVPSASFEVDKWDPALPTTEEKAKTLKDIVGESQNSKTYTVTFKGKKPVVDVTPTDPEKDPELPKKPDPNNPGKTTNEVDTDYTIIDFKTDGNGYLDANQTKRKSFAVLKTSTWASAQADPTGTPVGTAAVKLIVPSTADGATMKLTPKTDYDFEKWEPTLPQNDTLISAITGVTDNKITFVAKFTKRGDLVTPTISQDVQDFDGTNEKKVIKVNFNNPTEGSKAQLVKIGSDGSETPIGDPFNPTNGDSFRDIIETVGDPNRLVDGDKVKVKVTKDGSSPKYSDELVLDLAAPVFSDLKVERTADLKVKITGKVTDAKHDVSWVKCGNARGKLTPVTAGDNKVQTFEITVLVKDGQNKYQLVAKDVLANKSKDDDKSNQIEDTTDPKNVPKGQYVELRQPYEDQTKLVVLGDAGNKVVAYKYDQGKRVLLGKTTITNRRGIITVTALTKWERVYVVVLDKKNEAAYDTLSNDSLDTMDFGINPPTSMRVWSQDPSEEMPSENPVNPAGTGVAGGASTQV